MTATSPPPRVVVADDSPLMRRIVGSVLRRGGVEVVGHAGDGDEALALCERERPDAMTLDLTMPGLGGIDVLRALRERGRSTLPVVVVSAFSPASGARAVDALAEGAFELVQKPSVGEGEVEAFERNLLDKVRAAIELRARGRRSPTSPSATPRSRRRAVRRGVSRVLLIAASTGGPRALAELLPQLPAPLGVGTMIVQHMPAGFTTSLASRLDRACILDVREAGGGERLDPRVALVAPGGRHLRLDEDGLVTLSDAEPLGGLRPRADLLIADAARRFRDRLVLVVLTGMGNDGLRGAEEVRRHGGRILAEAEETLHRLRNAAGDRPGPAGRRRRPAARPARGDPGGGVLMSVIADDYVDFCDGVRQICGLDLSQYKRPQMERRLRSFFAAKGITRLTDCLESLRSDRVELDALLDRVTINVSQLWRHPEQWRTLERDVLPQLGAGETLRAWSAGCSYGAEAFTLAALCRRVLPAVRCRSSGPTSMGAWSPAPRKRCSPTAMPATCRPPSCSGASSGCPAAGGPSRELRRMTRFERAATCCA